MILVKKAVVGSKYLTRITKLFIITQILNF